MQTWSFFQLWIAAGWEIAYYYFGGDPNDLDQRFYFKLYWSGLDAAAYIGRKSLAWLERDGSKLFVRETSQCQ